MTEITITRALSELKTLRKRFTSEVRELNLVAVKQGEKLRSPNTSYKVEDFEKKAKESIQRVDALYNRIIAIKTAIDKSNSETMIKIGNHEMTIQDALVKKKYIELEEEKLAKLKNLMNKARQDFDDANNENNTLIEKMVAREDPSQKSGIKEDAEQFVNKTRKLSMVDPLGLDSVIKSLEGDIETFKTNIDYALSESNATTKISIPD